jgi:hypothetical protein
MIIKQKVFWKREIKSLTINDFFSSKKRPKIQKTINSLIENGFEIWY